MISFQEIIIRLATATEDQIEAIGRILDGQAIEKPDRVLTVKEAAARMGKSVPTVLRYCKNGTLRGFVAKGAKNVSGIWESSITNTKGTHE